MSDITKINANGAKFISHRGLSRIERQNTIPAFIAAANRSYFGIESDVQKTADGKYVLVHDDDLSNISTSGAVIAETDFDELRKVILRQRYGQALRADCFTPSLEEYIDICKRYDKWIYLELKVHFAEQDVINIISKIEEMGWIHKTIIITFHTDNIEHLRKNYPDLPVQLITDKQDTWWDEVLELLDKYNVDLDANANFMTEEMVKQVIARGHKCGVWSADDAVHAENLAKWGVEYITTDTLEGI